MLTIVTVTVWPDGKWHVHEIETRYRASFDRIVTSIYSSRSTKAAYLVNAYGKLVDSFVNPNVRMYA